MKLKSELLHENLIENIYAQIPSFNQYLRIILLSMFALELPQVLHVLHHIHYILRLYQQPRSLLPSLCHHRFYSKSDKAVIG